MNDNGLPNASNEYTPHHHTLDSESLKLLRESPRPPDELPTSLPTPTQNGGLRDLVRNIKSPIRSGTGTGGNHGRWTMIVYLYGDERRAIRRAIEENESFIRSALETGTNDAFARSWGDGMYRIFCEEWAYYRRHEV